MKQIARLAMLIGISIFGLLEIDPAKAAPMPSESDLLGIERVCAGGRTYGFSASMSTALKDWRRGAANASADVAVESLGAIIARIPHDATESTIYTDYTKCIRNLIHKILTTPDPNKVLLEPTVLEVRTARFRCLRPWCLDANVRETEELEIRTLTHGMLAQRVKMQAFLKAAVLPNFDSTDCPAKGNMPLLVTGFLIVDNQPSMFPRVTAMNDPTGTIGVLWISDVPSILSQKLNDLKVKLGRYANCVKLDTMLTGDLIVTYHDYQSVARTDYFSIELDLKSRDGVLFISQASGVHDAERQDRGIDGDPCVKKRSSDIHGEDYDQYGQNFSCEAHSEIGALNEFDATLHRPSNWQPK